MLRFSSHNLFIETGRYFSTNKNERNCIFCDLGVIEDEFHFILQCSRYTDLRKNI